MALSVREIRKANQEFYCDTYSPASNFRKVNLWASLVCTILIGIVLLAACEIISLMGYLGNAVRKEIGSEEVLDWAGNEVLKNLFDGPFWIIFIATIGMCVILSLFFRRSKSYEWHRKKKCVYFLLVVYTAMLILAPCYMYLTRDNMLSVIVIAMEFVLVPSLKLLLPPEFKAPFENIMKIFELIAQRIIKKV